MRAHGVPELSAYLRGSVSLQDARRRVELVTGQYTKRQATWFRHHNLANQTRTIIIGTRVTSLAQLSESFQEKLFTFIEKDA